MSPGRPRFLLFGPLVIEQDSVPLDIGIPQRSKEAGLLAVLLRRPGDVLERQDAARRVWDEERTPGSLTKCVTNLRRALRQIDVGLEAVDGGFRLKSVSIEDVDLHQFDRLRADALSMMESDPPEAMNLLREAIALRRATALLKLESAWLRSWRATVERCHVDARRDLLRLELAHGDTGAVSRILELHLNDPTDLKSADLAMRALAPSGGATEVYERTRSARASALTGAAATELDELHEQIVAGRFAVPAAGPAPVRIPRQLPAPLATFGGREAERRRLDKLLDESGGAPPVRIVIIEGQAGVGKTALAEYWADQVADRFSDGVLRLELNGFGRSGRPMRWPVALRTLLKSLGAGPVPAEPAERLNEYRTRTSGRHLLILLDDAADAEQIGPLVPAGPGSLVLVTSRRRQTGMQVRGATVISLEVPGADEARRMLSAYIADDRAAREPDVVDDILSICGRLPLALAIVGANAANQPEDTLGAVAQRFTAGLSAFGTDDHATDLPGLLDSSIRTLSPDHQLAVRLLGVHPGPSIDIAAAAAVTGRSHEEAGRCLRQLTAVHLMSRQRDDRFGVHDLVRDHLADLFDRLPAAERDPAVRRLYDYYLHTADACASRLRKYRQPMPLEPVAPGVAITAIPDSGTAREWLAAESDVLIRLITSARERRAGGHGWRLLAALADHFDWQGLWDDWIVAARAAREAAEDAGDVPGVARSRRSLGRALALTRAFGDAERELHGALELYRSLGDSDGQARVHHDLGALLDQRGDYAGALHECKQALALVKPAGPSPELADVLTAMAWVTLRMQDYAGAVEFGEQALALQQRFGFPRGQAAVLDTLGVARGELGDVTKALEYLELAADLCEQEKDLPGAAAVNEHLGDWRQRAGDPASAAEAWRTAAGILRVLKDPREIELRRRIGDVPGAA
jgi:DNA-binding SARP family transcriptional activator/tetratricopeptide (TPR) repeat protein